MDIKRGLSLPIFRCAVGISLSTGLLVGCSSGATDAAASAELGGKVVAPAGEAPVGLRREAPAPATEDVGQQATAIPAPVTQTVTVQPEDTKPIGGQSVVAGPDDYQADATDPLLETGDPAAPLTVEPIAPASVPVAVAQGIDITDPNSTTILVNKQNPLPSKYEPSDLVVPDVPITGSNSQMRAEAAAALGVMANAAKQEMGGQIALQSGYRSYATQQQLYSNYVNKDGQQKADTYSARPGFSEHQTGLAADLTEPGSSYLKFDDTKVGQWTAANAWRFGFIQRYTPENTAIVGYIPESWHFRYVGPEIASAYHDSGAIALEQFLGQPPAPDYAPAESAPISDQAEIE
jgi:zinc D-Ala-D-Ala carboxypeptidase